MWLFHYGDDIASRRFMCFVISLRRQDKSKLDNPMSRCHSCNILCTRIHNNNQEIYLFRHYWTISTNKKNLQIVWCELRLDLIYICKNYLTVWSSVVLLALTHNIHDYHGLVSHLEAQNLCYSSLYD